MCKSTFFPNIHIVHTNYRKISRETALDWFISKPEVEELQCIIQHIIYTVMINCRIVLYGMIICLFFSEQTMNQLHYYFTEVNITLITSESFKYDPMLALKNIKVRMTQ